MNHILLPLKLRPEISLSRDGHAMFLNVSIYYGEEFLCDLLWFVVHPRMSNVNMLYVSSAADKKVVR